jgi:WD40 repeat protein
METELNNNYNLSQSLFKHTGATRCVAVYKDKLISGGIDKKVNVFKRQGEKNLFEDIAVYAFFPDYVYSVVGFDDEKFVVGCKDGKIYVCTYEDTENPMIVLEGEFEILNFKRIFLNLV